jgi:hypothetical protein
MKTGELRRFEDDVDPDESEDGPLAGQTFVVITLHPPFQPGTGLGTVDFLVGGRLETGWNRGWVGRRSEVLDVVK